MLRHHGGTGRGVPYTHCALVTVPLRAYPKRSTRRLDGFRSVHGGTARGEPQPFLSLEWTMATLTRGLGSSRCPPARSGAGGEDRQIRGDLARPGALPVRAPEAVEKRHKLKITDDHQGIRVPVGHRHGPAAGRPCRRPRRTDSPRSQGLDGVQIPLIVCYTGAGSHRGFGASAAGDGRCPRRTAGSRGLGSRQNDPWWRIWKSFE
jgi:hypothetical protein